MAGRTFEACQRETRFGARVEQRPTSRGFDSFAPLPRLLRAFGERLEDARIVLRLASSAMQEVQRTQLAVLIPERIGLADQLRALARGVDLGIGLRVAFRLVRNRLAF